MSDHSLVERLKIIVACFAPVYCRIVARQPLSVHLRTSCYDLTGYLKLLTSCKQNIYVNYIYLPNNPDLVKFTQKAERALTHIRKTYAAYRRVSSLQNEEPWSFDDGAASVNQCFRRTATRS